MKKVIFISLAILIGTFAANSQCIPTKSGALPYSTGENLSYVLSYKWNAVNTDVATASLKLDTVRLNGKLVYHSKMTARTKSFFDAFFKARENFQSWFDIDTGRPLKYTRNTLEGKYTATNLYINNWSSRKIKANWQMGSRPKGSAELPLSDCTYDLPSIIYFLRRMDTSNLAPGKSYKVTYGIDDDVYTINLTFKGRETKKIRGIGKVKCLQFGCSVVAGEMFTGNEDAQLWVSDDENHIPIYFMAPLKVGAVTGRLSGYQGLTYKLNTQ